MKTLVDTARESFLILDADLRVISANPVFYQNFNVSPKQTEGRFFHELGNGQWNIPELKGLLGEILPKKKTVRNYEVEHVFEEIGKRIIILNARQIDAVKLIIIAMEDITVARELETSNKNMVGRELKMVELKKVIVDLKKEIGDLKKLVKNGIGTNGNGKKGNGNLKNSH